MAYQKRKQKRVKVKRSTDAFENSAHQLNGTERIEMKRRDKKTNVEQPEPKINAEPKKQTRKFKLISGGLRESSRRRTHSLIFAAVTVAIIAAMIIVNAILPTGLVEWSQNKFSALGSDGKLPKLLNGDKVDDLRSRGGELFIMSDAYMYAYNTAGKCITTVQHGYNSPRLELSFTRTLIYDRGSYGLRVDSLYTNFVNTQLENKIVTADISDSGYVAVATESNEYSAEVTVYDSKFKSLFKWSAATGQVSALKLSPDGKYLAAAVVSGVNGDYSSEISIFEIKSGVRTYSKVYNGSMFVKVYAAKDAVTFVGIDECVSFGWNGLNEAVNNFYRLEYFDATDKNMIAAYHPDGDDRHFTVSVFDRFGIKVATLVIQGDADRVCVNEDYVYTYSSGTVNKYDFSGSLVSTFNIGYEYVFMVSHKNGVGLTYDMTLDFVS